MECTLCRKHYLAKAEINFKIRLNNQRNVIKHPHPKTILPNKHFRGKIYITSMNVHNSLLYANLPIHTKKRSSTKALNSKRKLLDSNSRHYIPKRTEEKTQ